LAIRFVKNNKLNKNPPYYYDIDAAQQIILCVTAKHSGKKNYRNAGLYDSQTVK